MKGRLLVEETNEKLYGPIGIARLLDIEVYHDGILKYNGLVDDAPEEIKNLKYKSINIVNGKGMYEV